MDSSGHQRTTADDGGQYTVNIDKVTAAMGSSLCIEFIRGATLKSPEEVLERVLAERMERITFLQAALDALQIPDVGENSDYYEFENHDHPYFGFDEEGLYPSWSEESAFQMRFAYVEAAEVDMDLAVSSIAEFHRGSALVELLKARAFPPSVAVIEYDKDDSLLLWVAGDDACNDFVEQGGVTVESFVESLISQEREDPENERWQGTVTMELSL